MTNLASLETGDFVLAHLGADYLWIRVDSFDRGDRRIAGILDQSPIPAGFERHQPLSCTFDEVTRVVKAGCVNAEIAEIFFSTPRPSDRSFDEAFDALCAADPNGILAQCQSDVADARLALHQAELRLARVEAHYRPQR